MSLHKYVAKHILEEMDFHISQSGELPRVLEVVQDRDKLSPSGFQPSW